MTYAVAGKKTLAGSWKVVRTHRRKNKKIGGKAFVSSRNGKWFSRCWVFIKKLTRWSMIALLIAACSYGIHASYQFATHSPKFAVSKVTFNGNQKLGENELIKWLGPVQGENIFSLNLESLSTQLAAHPWVRKVSVRKVFPHTIRVLVEERKPYARIKLDRVYVIDNFGVLLAPETPEFSHLSLVVHPPSKEETVLGKNAAGDGIISSLQTMHYFNKLSFFADNPIQSAEIDRLSRVVFTTGDGNMKVFMDLETISQNFKNFLIVRDTLEKDKNNIEHIDLSFKDQIVVKRKENT